MIGDRRDRNSSDLPLIVLGLKREKKCDSAMVSRSCFPEYSLKASVTSSAMFVATTPFVKMVEISLSSSLLPVCVREV